MIWLFVVLPLATGAFLFLFADACRRELPPKRQQLPEEVIKLGEVPLLGI
jgi:hypothetical protein